MENKYIEIDKPKILGVKATSVNILMDLYCKAKENNISFKKAIEFGIRFLIADNNECGYPACKLQDKLFKTVAHRNTLMQEILMLRDPIKDTDEIENAEDDKVNKEEIDAEVKDVLGGLINGKD